MDLAEIITSFTSQIKKCLEVVLHKAYHKFCSRDKIGIVSKTIWFHISPLKVAGAVRFILFLRVANQLISNFPSALLH